MSEKNQHAVELIKTPEPFAMQAEYQRLERIATHTNYDRTKFLIDTVGLKKDRLEVIAYLRASSSIATDMDTAIQILLWDPVLKPGHHATESSKKPTKDWKTLKL